MILSSVCLLFKQVKTALPIGFLYIIDNSIRPFVIALEIKSKLGVSPLIIIPIEINPSYFFIFLAIVTGISNAPLTN